MVDYGAVDLYWGRCGRIWRCGSLLGTVWYDMSLYISTGDVVVGNGAIDLYWGRNGRVLCFISPLGTMLITGDGVEGYVAVDLYWGRICSVVLFYMSTRNVEICSCRSPLGT